MPTSTYTTKLWDRLDKITYDRYGSTDNDLVLFVIEANPGLENEGLLLTPGLKITLPDAPSSTTTMSTPTIVLW